MADPKPLRADARRNRARVLDSAEAVFAAAGPAASMEEVARHAGVGVGTIYRHFPTKEALFEAIVVSRYERLAEEADSLASAADAGAAFFGLFTRMVEEAATKKAFADTLVRAGVDVKAATSASGRKLVHAFGGLLARAQGAGAVRDDADITEVMAILAGMTLAAEHASWDRDLRTRALGIVFDGLRSTRPR
ncbi:TetR/AcrR family transcriptional regulator [Nonomuraea sp. NEAU-A123]|uniref:TetR/AcrR family transcriptional regulator n=1 Tax=Nonomuraea sp. NEAU-A123 TaxID=2839649 RepID=UPI001BE4147C|nr:TetR/AcrR family transcriptional regulator [Nonomuraea sp. NEAU-A123]MBT2227677.1 TetR/AcrR family transcriptional regulator [Nonomuraea sp. NEAU-A123]